MSRAAVDLLVDGLAVRFTDGYAASAPALKRALAALCEEGKRDAVSVRWPWFARRVAAELFADDTWHYLATRSVHVARESGALAVLPLALHPSRDTCAASRAISMERERSARRGRRHRGRDGHRAVVFGRVALAGFRGIEAEAAVVFDAAVPAAIARGGEGVVLTFAEHARAVLYNGLGRYESRPRAGSECRQPG